MYALIVDFLYKAEKFESKYFLNTLLVKMAESSSLHLKSGLLWAILSKIK